MRGPARSSPREPPPLPWRSAYLTCPPACLRPPSPQMPPQVELVEPPPDAAVGERVSAAGYSGGGPA